MLQYIFPCGYFFFFLSILPFCSFIHLVQNFIGQLKLLYLAINFISTKLNKPNVFLSLILIRNIVPSGITTYNKFYEISSIGTNKRTFSRYLTYDLNLQTK